MRHLKKWVTLGLMLQVLCCLHAESSGAVEDSDRPSTKGWYLFGGLDAGLSLLKTSVTGEENKSGLGGNLKLLGSSYWDKWVFDGGIGVEYKNISGTRPSGFIGTLETQTLLLEVDLRRRFGVNWELGLFLAANALADVSHRPTVSPLITESSKNLIFLTGIEGLYTIVSGRTPLRFGARIETDLNISNRRLWEFQAVIHIGFPLFASETTPAPLPPPPPVVETAVEKPQEFFDINLLRVLFDTGSAKLKPHSVAVLGKLAKYFKGHLESFTKLEVEGHTDHVGGASYNLDLSQRRAQSVADILVANGIPNNIVLARGYGFSRPLVKDTEKADQHRNRRVAIRVFGAGEKSEFVSELKKLVK